MGLGMRWRLSWMMALVYAVQGAFWPVLAIHLTDLGMNGHQRGWVFATLSIGSLAMPLGFGQLVDRLMPSQRLLSLIYAAACALLVVLASGAVVGAGPVFTLCLVFWMIVAPAFALSSSIAMRHLERPYEQFAGVRFWGTVGWMAVGWTVSLVMFLSGSAYQGRGAFEAFWVGALIAGTLACYGLTLPDTPPLAAAGPSDERTSRPGLRRALALAREPGMPVFFITAFGVHLTTPFVYQVLPTYLEARGMPRAWISTALTLGQWPELVVLAALPWVLRRLGTKGTLALGILAWGLRFGSLVIDLPLWVAVAGIPLHGVAYACFTVAGQIYTDSRAPRELRASGQALFLVVTSGLGNLCGSLLAGSTSGHSEGDGAGVFIVPCVIDLALLLYFCAAFRPNVRNEGRAGGPLTTSPLPPDAVRARFAHMGSLVTEPADG